MCLSFIVSDDGMRLLARLPREQAASAPRLVGPAPLAAAQLRAGCPIISLNDTFLTEPTNRHTRQQTLDNTVSSYHDSRPIHHPTPSALEEQFSREGNVTSN